MDRTPHRSRLPLAATLAVVVAACAPRPSVAPAPSPAPVTGGEARPTFPPIPRTTGPVALRVTYPPAGATVSARDSTFIFGSLGTGEATLTVNGRPVDVLPNGGWLAWLPLPPRDRPIYDLVAVRGNDTTRASHRIAYPPERRLLPRDGSLVVDTASLTPRLPFARRSDESVSVTLRVTPTAAVWLRWAGDSVRPFSSGNAAGWANGAAEVRALAVPARVLARGDARIYAALGRDTVSLGAPRIALADSAWTSWGYVGGAPSTADRDSSVIIARPVVGGTYKWFLFPGTLVAVTGEQGSSTRIRLDPALEVWVDGASVQRVAPGAAPVARVAGNARVRGGAGYSELVIPMAARPPWSVDEQDDALVLTLFGTTANSDIINFASSDSVIRHVTWEQAGEGRAVYRVALREPSYGYVVRWERNALVLRVRRAPRIDRDRPLQGIIVAVDPGHPPAGSTGPTGLYEGVATLAIAERAKRLFEARGATVVLTRTTAAAVDLGARQPMAANAGAHAFVSIHLNALPDGVNPFVSHGTGTYWFNPSSADFARHVQRGMVRRMGLRDLGTNYDNLAVLRPSWMPSILCEGAFVMMPDQEALLRMPEFQEAYALGVVEGVESYFRSLGETQRRP